MRYSFSFQLFYFSSLASPRLRAIAASRKKDAKRLLFLSSAHHNSTLGFCVIGMAVVCMERYISWIVPTKWRMGTGPTRKRNLEMSFFRIRVFEMMLSNKRFKQLPWGFRSMVTYVFDICRLGNRMLLNLLYELLLSTC